ncbi:MAG TPA: sodium-dependent transporter [Bacteroidales bacterium]|nr:sodium-dependent transporter [Bacteroidales bacterium]
MTTTPAQRDSFTSKFGVIAAAAGSAIGLGNIWRFPYVAGENGGAAFLFVYLTCVVIIGVPVMMSEFVIGRSAQRNPYGSFRMLAPGKPWYLVGLMGVVAAFMILAFYTVVAGWTLEYIYQSFTGNLVGKSTIQLKEMFNSFRHDSVRPVLWFVIFMGFTGWIVIAGIKNGIEKYTKVLMPMLFVMLIGMAVYVLTFEGSSKGLHFLFNPDFSKITPEVILEALGQAFFSLSIGMGTLITYGSYIKKSDNLGSTAISVAGADTFIAILAGMAIFPAIYAFADVEHLQVSQITDEGLVFITLPNILINMPGGTVFSTLFFILLGVAALTSTISVLEVIVAYFVEELGLVRRRATVLATASVSVLGILSVFFAGVFGFLNFTTANILLPVGGFFIVIFIGWYYGSKKTREELSNSGKLKSRYVPAFMFIVRFIAPIAIVIVFAYGIMNAFRDKNTETPVPATETVQPAVRETGS